MPSNRSNSERGKAFVIDTKIEYMNKLYEVRESYSCADCSIASICSNSDICGGIDIDDTLSKDKRINIFGACSSAIRPDTKFVVVVFLMVKLNVENVELKLLEEERVDYDTM